MQILLATGNPHKVDEVRAVLEGEGVELCSLSSLDSMPEEPVEDADTFAGNARLKAVGYARATGRRCLADDSGLEVDALNGRPGVHSARSAGTGDTRDERDAANNAKLLLAMEAVPDNCRTARFVCCMCIADPDGTVIAQSRGTFEGSIARLPKGTNGFGYDPLLLLPDGRSSAQLEPSEKNQRSHRAQATIALAHLLRQMLVD